LDRKYVAAEEALRKLELAYGLKTSVYIYGATGYGKTRLAKEYLDGKEAFWFSANDPEWNYSLIEESISNVKYVVIDDLQQMQDSDRREFVEKIIKRGDIWVVLIGRMPTPQWMLNFIANGELMVISEENLHLSVNDVKRIAEGEDVILSDADAERITFGGEGNAYIAAATIQLIKSGERFDGTKLADRIKSAFVKHLEDDIIPQWSTALQEFLMEISVVDEFTLPMAIVITGDDRAASILDETVKVGNFLSLEDGVYRLRPYLIEALNNRALKIFGQQKYNYYVDNAGLYYETRDMVPEALKMYEKSGNTGRISSLLIKNGRRHFGDGHFYELKKYYLQLSEEEAENNTVLMSALCMLYSVMMNPDLSEYWYGKLRDYSNRVEGGARREAYEMLLYLDIALPHRGSINLIDLIKRAVSLKKSGGFKLPEFSVTNNQPSTMNGGKDFCNWSKMDQFLADTIGKPLERFLGSFGRGLVHAALAESLYEKGEHDADVSHHAMLAHLEVEGGGKVELLFAAVGVQVRLSMITGNTRNASQLLDTFEKRLINENKTAMLRNLKALRCRVMLMMGNSGFAEKWMEEAPNEVEEFWVLDRYLYVTKVLCYLDQGRNLEAINLIERLLYYSEVNKRTYIHLESGILLAIANKREKREWKEEFIKLLIEISEYKFVRIISEKGAGVLPLLKEIKKEYLENRKADVTWFGRLLKETAMIAERYPSQLNCDSVQPSDFGETSMEILRLQASGLSIKEIAEKLELSERTVKYHASENYKKLGAKGKTDAVQKARSMNLI